MFKEYVHDFVTLQFVPCHRKKERTLCINGKYFPICSRCMAILLGYLFIIPLFFIHIQPSFFLGVLFNIPMVLDGYTQLKKWRKSNNYLRIITGLLSGFGQSLIILSLSNMLVHFIMTL